ncbi:MAG: RNA polymerase sigma factor [Clostridia bacterium]|nr:RNA polymerase sigma factor [Clostridia bacterium]
MNGESSYRRFIEGDESGFNDIVHEYRLNMIFFVNRFVNDIDVAEDICADVFVNIYENKHRYNFKTPLKTYLFVIARNKAIDCLRKRKKETILDENIVQSEDELIDAVISDEEKRRLSKAMDGLNVDYRTALHLVYFEELSYADAAKVMRKSEKQIKNLVYRAKIALKRDLSV